MMGVKTIWEPCLFEVAPFGSLWRLQMGIFSFLTERDWSRKSCYGNSTSGVILFLFWCTFVVPSFKNTASIFPEISFNQYFPLFSCKQYDVITDLICIIEKRQYLLNEKRYLKKKSTILLHFERPFKYAQISFHFIGTLRMVNRGEEKVRVHNSHRGQKIFSLPRVVPCFHFTRANAQWVIHGFK